MKITVISDTHGEHEKLGRLSGDVLIHCGDMFQLFDQQQEEDFERIDAWFGRQDFDLILCTGGNHDFELEKRAWLSEQPFSNAVYLQGQSYRHDGVHFYGAPWVPDLYGHAFFAEDDELYEKWADIPDSVDVLITHTPPAGILDRSSRGAVLGCHHLLNAIERTSPSLHCFGHVHASSGIYDDGNTTFINAAMVSGRYQLTETPFEIHLPVAH